MATPASNNAPQPGAPQSYVAKSPASGTAYVVRPRRERLPYGRGAPRGGDVPDKARGRDRPDTMSEARALAMLNIALTSKSGMLAQPFVRVRRSDTGAILVGPYRDRTIRYASIEDAAWALAGGFLLE